MLLPGLGFGDRMAVLTEADYEDSPEYVGVKERLRKTLYYGKLPPGERPSLAMTELAVELLQDLAPKDFGKVDMYWASDLTAEMCASPCALVLAMLYIKRLKHRDSPYLHQVSSSDLLLVAMMVASKYLYDEGEVETVLNDEWAAAVSAETEDVNQLERSFLAAIDWKIFVTKDDFYSALVSMEKKIAWKRSQERGGSFTYTDVTVLSGDGRLATDLHRSLLHVCKVIAVCLVSYCACLAPLALSPHALALIQPFPAFSIPALSGSDSTIVLPDVAHLFFPSSFVAASSPGIDFLICDSIIDQGKSDLSDRKDVNLTKFSEPSVVMPTSVEPEEMGMQPVGSQLKPGKVDWMPVGANQKPDEINPDPCKADFGPGEHDLKPDDANAEPCDAELKPGEGDSKPHGSKSSAFVLPRFLTLALTCDMVATSVVEALARWLYPPKPSRRSADKLAPDSLDEVTPKCCDRSGGMACKCSRGCRRVRHRVGNRKDRRSRIFGLMWERDHKRKAFVHSVDPSPELGNRRGKLNQKDAFSAVNIAYAAEFDATSEMFSDPLTCCTASCPSALLPCRLGSIPSNACFCSKSAYPFENCTTFHGAFLPCSSSGEGSLGDGFSTRQSLFDHRLGRLSNERPTNSAAPSSISPPRSVSLTSSGCKRSKNFLSCDDDLVSSSSPKKRTMNCTSSNKRLISLDFSDQRLTMNFHPTDDWLGNVPSAHVLPIDFHRSNCDPCDSQLISHCQHGKHPDSSLLDGQRISSTPSQAPGSMIGEGSIVKARFVPDATTNTGDQLCVQLCDLKKPCQLESSSHLAEPVNLVLGPGQPRLLQVAG